MAKRRLRNGKSRKQERCRKCHSWTRSDSRAISDVYCGNCDPNSEGVKQYTPSVLTRSKQ